MESASTPSVATLLDMQAAQQQQANAPLLQALAALTAEITALRQRMGPPASTEPAPAPPAS